MTFKTIRETARVGILPEHELRRRAKCGTLPGVYAGVKFLVNVDLLMQQLEAESRRNAGMDTITANESTAQEARS